MTGDDEQGRYEIDSGSTSCDRDYATEAVPIARRFVRAA